MTIQRLNTKYILPRSDDLVAGLCRVLLVPLVPLAHCNFSTPWAKYSGKGSEALGPTADGGKAACTYTAILARPRPNTRERGQRPAWCTFHCNFSAPWAKYSGEEPRLPRRLSGRSGGSGVSAYTAILAPSTREKEWVLLGGWPLQHLRVFSTGSIWQSDMRIICKLKVPSRTSTTTWSQSSSLTEDLRTAP